MRTKFFVFVYLLLLANNLVAQDKDTLVRIKGYIFYAYRQSDVKYLYDIEFKKTYAERHKKNFTYEMPFDAPLLKFFIPVQVANNVISVNDIFADTTLYPINDSVYITPDRHFWEDGFEFIFGKKYKKFDFSHEKCILNAAWKFCPYYENIGNKKSFYKIIYIEGFAKVFVKTDDNKIKIAFFFGDTYKYGKVFFFINKITNYSTIINLPNLNVWYPYLENE
jgi:hypothetical protein